MLDVLIDCLHGLNSLNFNLLVKVSARPPPHRPSPPHPPPQSMSPPHHSH